ncbi:MAG TPA: MFS transporter [Planctomycetota bacterium]|nr:MFS transporter [Planctomycetota bacterium]
MTEPLKGSLNFRLSLMMFLQYAIWGAWLPMLWSFLKDHRGFAPDEIGWIFSVGAIGAIIGPFVAGHLADRHVSTEKFLGISHLLGAALVWQLAVVSSFQAFLWMSLVYGLVYAPTLSLTNSLSFHHVPDRDRDFGRVRVWGTVGWIAAGIAIGQWLLYQYKLPDGTEEKLAAAALNAGRADAFRLSAILGGLLGLYCFTLPKTPPSKTAKQANTVVETLSEVRRQPLITLFLLAVPVSCIHQFYFVHTGSFLSQLQASSAKADDFARAIQSVFGVGGGGLMTVGQMSEILVLGLIPLLAKKVSRKSLLLVGLLAYAGRMALFAHCTSMVPILLGVALHGLAFGCFIFVAFMVVDEETTSDVRASAQSLFNLVIIGIGTIVGSLIAGHVNAWATEDGVVNYTKLFSVPLWASLACFLVLFLFYPNRSRARAGAEHSR